MNNDKKPDNTGNNRNEDGTFKSGVSGNPNGRPKGSTSIADILRKIGEEEIPAELSSQVQSLFGSLDSNELKDMKMTEGLLRFGFMYAIRGKHWAVQFIADRTEGKPREFIEQKIIKDELIVE